MPTIQLVQVNREGEAVIKLRKAVGSTGMRGCGGSGNRDTSRDAERIKLLI